MFFDIFNIIKNVFNKEVFAAKRIKKIDTLSTYYLYYDFLKKKKTHDINTL